MKHVFEIFLFQDEVILSGKDAKGFNVEAQYEQFSIQFVSRVTGINPHTIRAWEKRHQVVVPERDKKGRRLYNQCHIDRLIMLQDLIEIGNKISDLAKMSNEQVKSLCDQYTDNNRTPGCQKPDDEKLDANQVLQNLLLALQHYKLDIISHELEKVQNKLSLRDFTLSILLPLFSEVGVQVQRKLLSPAQESALTSLVKFNLGKVLHQNYVVKNNSRFNAILIATEGERCEVGTLVSALLCHHYKVNFYYLGAGLTLDATIEAYDQISPNLIISCLSKQLEEQDEDRIQAYVKTISDHLGDKAELWLGGVHESKVNGHKNVKMFSSIRSLDQMLKKA